MRIVFLTHYFPPEINAPATRTFEHCRIWAKEGHHITVVTGVPNAPEGIVYKGYRNKIFQRENVSGIDVIRVWTWVAANKGFLRRILNYVSFMFSSMAAAFRVKRPDVVAATSPQFFCGLAGYFFSRLKRTSFVLEIRDLWPDSIAALDALPHPAVISFLRKIEMFLYRKADTIIVVTDAFKTEIMKKGIPGEKISVIKNGVDLAFYDPQTSDRELRNELKLNGSFVAAYIGTVGMAHGLSQVLRAAEDLKEEEGIRFLIVGAGAEREKLRSEAEARGLSNVLFVDKQPKERIRQFYALADLCLVTLKNNPLFKTVIPSKVFEMMAMKKPILLGVDGEVKELVVGQADAGRFFEPENAAELKKNLLDLYRDPDRRKSLGENGRRFVERNFDRDRLARRFLDELEKACRT